MKLSSNEIKQYLADWTIVNINSLQKRQSHPSNPDGQKARHWTRRGKTSINSEIVRVFECYVSKTQFPNDFAVTYEKNGKLRLEWKSETEVLQMGIKLTDSIGTIWQWSNGKKEVVKRFMPG